MNNYSLSSLRWCCTHIVHSRRNCIFNNSWAGFTTVWPQQMFPFLLQKLEEFLFCMEDNHPEVGNANTPAARLHVASVIKVMLMLGDAGESCQLTLTYRWLLSPFFSIRSILICMRSPGWCDRLSGFAPCILRPLLSRGGFCWACIFLSAPSCFKFIH